MPWIQNKTIKENILFGLEYDEDLYTEVIDICQLKRDLEILPSGDETEIGEKGINLSGGQKARVGLARAVYSNREVFLMDDPISALDANVKKKIFKHVLTKRLKERTRILVTHAIDFLHLVDKIILLKEGKIVFSGPYEQVKGNSYLKELVRIHKTNQAEQKSGAPRVSEPLTESASDSEPPLTSISDMESEDTSSDSESEEGAHNL